LSTVALEGAGIDLDMCTRMGINSTSEGCSVASEGAVINLEIATLNINSAPIDCTVANEL
jgi:hypothetical protein